MNKKKIIFTLTAVALLILPCTAESTHDSAEQHTFVAAICSGIPNLHPHTAYNADDAQILTALYEGLFVYDPYTLEPIPAMAKAWEVSGDGLEWIFTLRNGLFFENGTPITAQTFRDSFLNILSPTLELPYASLLDCVKGAKEYRSSKNTDAGSVAITALSDTTLRILLIHPAEHLPNILCHHAFAPVHPSQLEEAAQFFHTTTFEDAQQAFHPIASGSFKIDSFDNEKLQLVKNTAYWDAESVSLPSITLLLKKDAQETADAFNKGDIHWISDNPQLNKIAAMNTVNITPMFATEFFYFRTDVPPLNDVTVRKALLSAIPYDTLRKDALIPAQTLILPLAGYPAANGIDTYDIKNAQKLLKKAAKTLKDTPPINILLPKTEYYTKQAALLKKAWEEAGLQVKISSVPFSLYYAQLNKKQYHMGLISWIADFADPLALLELFRVSSSLNNTGWKNNVYEDLITTATAERNRKKRFDVLGKAEQLLLDEAVIIPLSHVPAINVIDLHGIKGWYSNAVDIHPFKFIRFIQPKSLPGVALK